MLIIIVPKGSAWLVLLIQRHADPESGNVSLGLGPYYRLACI